MERQLNIYLVLPLRDMALRRMAVFLINKPELLASTANFPVKVDAYYKKKWIETVESMIRDTISKLALPSSLTKELVLILKAVGSEVLKWKSIHKPYFKEFNVRVLEKLCWTTAGAVDYLKTAETLVHSGVVDTVQQFELACLYCMENCVTTLWTELPENYKQTFCEDRDPSPDLRALLPYMLKKHSICARWSVSEIRSDCLQYSALFGIKTATEHSFKMVSNEDRNVALHRTFSKISPFLRKKYFIPTQEGLSDVAFYLLSQMTPEVQLATVQEFAYRVFTGFLDWPWQNLCLQIADVLWSALPKTRYGVLMNRMKSHFHYSGYYLPSFFQEFFRSSPRAFRKRFVYEECRFFMFFEEFFRAEDTHSMCIVFQNIDSEDKERLVFSLGFFTLFRDFLLSKKGQIVEDCISNAMLSDECRISLKEAFAKFLGVTVEFPFRSAEIRRFFQFLDGVEVDAAGKRSGDDETLAQVKKLRTDEEKNTLPRN